MSAWALVTVTRDSPVFGGTVGVLAVDPEVRRAKCRPIDEPGKVWWVALGSDLARGVHGVPIGTAGLRISDGVGIMGSAFVREEWRGRGIYTAMAKARVAISDRLGCKVCRATCTEVTATILTDLGFGATCSRGQYTVMERRNPRTRAQVRLP